MKITTLIEDTPGDDKSLKFEHGLSMFIETSKCNILFDSGQTGNIIENAEVLNIDLNKIDYIVLSHGHYDHCGGIKRLLDNFHIKPKLIVGKGFFERCDKYRIYDEDEINNLNLKSKYKKIGIDFNKKYIEDKGIEIIEAHDSGVTRISEDVFIFSNFEQIYDFENIGNSMKYLKENGVIDSSNICKMKNLSSLVNDDFKEEIAIGLKTKKGILLLMGCSHFGISNMVKTIEKRCSEKIMGLIGGTHLIKADEYRINKTIEVLKSMDLNIIGLSHCTGENALKYIEESFKDLFINKTGTVLNL